MNTHSIPRYAVTETTYLDGEPVTIFKEMWTKQQIYERLTQLEKNGYSYEYKYTPNAREIHVSL